MNATGKTAPSFIFTIVLLVLLVIGYFAWGIFWPGPIAHSEMLVRNFGAASTAELGPLRRALREEVIRYERDPATLESVRTAIDEHVEKTRNTIERLANGAIDELVMIDGIGLRTQDNRLRRIRQRQTEADARVDDLQAEALAKLPVKSP